ncbi:MAG: hypothetical protein K6G10_06920 [Butyrivibrio sp.]|nr:hypothetical protein [Butyrivibrio sp.]
MDSNINEALAAALNEIPSNNEPSMFRTGQYEIVSKVAYLLGVNKRFFETSAGSFLIDEFEKLENDKRAKIIRCLCKLRSSLMHNFKKVLDAIKYDQVSIMNMPDLMPQDLMDYLYHEGITDIYSNLKDPTPYMINLNRNIQNRINNCKDLFPEWIKWDYLSNIYIMPNGLSAQGTKDAASLFYENTKLYPYKQYMNWPVEDEGNILISDKKFITLLYKWHGEEFKDLNLVCDASSKTKEDIYAFIENSNRCVVVVDCENSDPYRLCAAIKNLDADKMSKIDKLILFDDIHAASAWEILSSYVDIPVEYILIERIKDNKSLTDIKVATRISKEFYSNNIDSFVLVSSDSDYWGLIEEIPEANFFVMVERDSCSSALKTALSAHGLRYCYLDDFYAGNALDIKHDALQKDIAKTIKETLSLDMIKVFEDALAKTRIAMTDEEKKNFVNKRIKNQIELDMEDLSNIKLHYKAKK